MEGVAEVVEKDEERMNRKDILIKNRKKRER